MATKDEILDRLREVMDPELGVNIVDLGLVYKIQIKRGKKKGKQQVKIDMTFTTPACPLVNFMLDNVEKKLNEIKDADFEVNIVFEPKWTPGRLSPEAKKRLGIK